VSSRLKGVILDRNSFVKDWKQLPAPVKAEFRKLVPTLLLSNPASNRLRLHSLSGFKPTIWKIDVTKSGKLYQASYHIVGANAVFLRICIHKEMDRRPA